MKKTETNKIKTKKETRQKNKTEQIKTKQRSGMVGMLQREEVDIQLGALTILAAREQVYD